MIVTKKGATVIDHLCPPPVDERPGSVDLAFFAEPRSKVTTVGEKATLDPTPDDVVFCPEMM